MQSLFACSIIDTDNDRELQLENVVKRKTNEILRNEAFVIVREARPSTCQKLEKRRAFQDVRLTKDLFINRLSGNTLLQNS